MNNKFLVVILLILYSCSNSDSNFQQASISDYTGKYFNTSTGEIVFEIVSDTTGYFMASSAFNPALKEDKILITIPNDESKIKWEKRCNKSYDELMSFLIGDFEWKENIHWILEITGEDAFMVKTKKGYHSHEYVYLTGYALIVPSDCGNRHVPRINLDKL